MIKYKFIQKSNWPQNYVPTANDVKKYLAKWNNDPVLKADQQALSGLFTSTCGNYGLNINLDVVIIKAAALDSLYNTHVSNILEVAQKIVSIPDFDKRLASGDLNLVNDFRRVTPSARDNYSFATKYCNFHQPDKFPIFDHLVACVLTALSHYKKVSFNKNFKTFKSLRDYQVYTDAIDAIKSLPGMKSFTYKEIDQYLWQLGKKHFF